MKLKKDFNVINPFDFNELEFDVIVGNPPYMKSEDMKNITPLELPLYKKKFESAYKQFDKYFLFIEQGLNLLAEDGLLGFIVPGKFTKVGAGKKLREKLSSEKVLHSITSFGANQIFADKTTYTCLLVLYKKKHQTFQYTEVKNLKRWKIRQSEELAFSGENVADLDNEVWVLIPPDLRNAYEEIISQSTKLSDLVGAENIFNGIQTSANAIYIFSPSGEDDDFYYFSKNGVDYRIETEITKPYFKTSSGTDNLYTYRTFKPNARVIYPYKRKDNGVDIIPLGEIKKKYPFAFDYLQKHKKILNNPKRDIKPEPTSSNEWHRYGRHQSLDSCGLPEKIIVGVLSVGDKYAVDFNGTLISSGGTAGYCVVAMPENSNYSIYYLQAILNSKYLEWFSSLYGEVFRGGYIARGTKVLKNLPVREIDFASKKEKLLHNQIAETQKKLIEIFDEIDANMGNNRILIPLQRKFEKEKKVLEKRLRELYNLGKDDALIPLIKELYEAD